MELNDLLNKTCLIGLSWFDRDGKLLRQSQLAGRVVAVDREAGISVELMATAKEAADSPDPQPQKSAIFMLPADLSPWFRAPSGRYRDPDSGVAIVDPDYLVTWDVYQTRDDAGDGQHQWWQWSPRTAAPRVNR